MKRGNLIPAWGPFDRSAVLNIKDVQNMKSATLFVLALCMQRIIPAQTIPGSPRFEVASVRRASTEFTAGARSTGLGQVEISSQRASYRNITLKSLVAKAYDIKDFQVSGPAWIDSDRYDIIATIPEGTSEAKVPVMLQSLLVERFQMKIRRIRKPYEGYVLSVAKGGPKLTPAAHPKASNTRNVSDSTTVSFGEHPEVHMFGITMPALGNYLSNVFKRPVLDSTQLAGKFDLSLPAAPGVFDGPEAETYAITGLRDVGLTLTPSKVPLEAIVVDKATETPSGN